MFRNVHGQYMEVNKTEYLLKLRKQSNSNEYSGLRTDSLSSDASGFVHNLCD